MKNDILDVFDQVENVEFKEITEDLLTFTLADPTPEEWNRKAKIQNTKMFVELHNRLPANYEEVSNWINKKAPFGERKKHAG